MTYLDFNRGFKCEVCFGVPVDSVPGLPPVSDTFSASNWDRVHADAVQHGELLYLHFIYTGAEAVASPAVGNWD